MLYVMSIFKADISHSLAPHLFGKVAILVISVYNYYKALQENGQPDKKSKAFAFRIYILTPLEKILSQTCECLLSINYFL